MNRWIVGVSAGIVAGVIDVIPMILQKLPWDANASAFAFWVVGGVLISITQWSVPPILKGMGIQLMAMIPVAILVAAKEPVSLIPMSIMTVILGGAVGYVTQRFAGHTTTLR